MSRFELFDRFEIDDAANVRTTKDGYMTAMPRVARTGIQLYRGRELGRPDLDVVRVYRPEAEVFKADSMHSFAHRPFTDDHPPVQVTADNWKEYATGQSGGEVARDGAFLRVPMVLMDKAAIKKFKDGKVELSVGYTCDVKWGEGTTPDGEAYDAMQTDISCNHIAQVKAARGGKDLKIGDGEGTGRLVMDSYAAALTALLKGNINKDALLADVKTGTLARDSKGADLYPVMIDGAVSLVALNVAKVNAIAKGDGDVLAAVDSMLSLIGDHSAPIASEKDNRTMADKTIVIDGITVGMSDTAIEVVQRALRTADANMENLKKAKEKAEEETEEEKKKSVKKDADIVAKDAEIVKLQGQLKDAEITPARLDALVANRNSVIAIAKAVLPAVVVDNKTTGEIKKQVVDAKMGDKAKAYDDASVSIAFDSLTAGIDVTKANDNRTTAHRPGGVQDQAAQFSHQPVNLGDARETALDARDERMQNAWRGDAAKTA